jgi:hypothetical protein
LCGYCATGLPYSSVAHIFAGRTTVVPFHAWDALW